MILWWKVGLRAVKAKTWLVIADCHHLPPTQTMVNLLSGTSQPVVMWKSRLSPRKNFEALNFIRISGLKYPQACWCYLWIVSVWTRPERQNVLHLCEISHPCSYVPPEWRKHHIVQNISPNTLVLHPSPDAQSDQVWPLLSPAPNSSLRRMTLANLPVLLKFVFPRLCLKREVHHVHVLWEEEQVLAKLGDDCGH